MILSALCIVGLAFSAAPLADTAACIPHVIHGNQIVGHGARTCQGEYVGRVTDIIIAPQENRISHVLISDVQLRLVVVPWEAVTVRLDDGIIVNATLDRLGQGPFLSFDDWGNLSDPQWQAHVRTSFGLSPYADPAVAMSGCDSLNVKLGDVMRMDVTASGLRRVGGVFDIIAEPCGRILYAAVLVNEVCDPHLAVVPWCAAHVVPHVGKVMVNAPASAFTVTCFEEDCWPDLCDVTYAEHVHACFGVTPYWTNCACRELRYCPKNAWATGSRYNLLFDTQQMARVDGFIKDVGSFCPKWGGERGLKLEVRTKDGPLYTIHAGPISQAEASGIRFCKGQRVSIDGSLNRKNDLMATEIRVGNVQWRVRDNDGCLLW